MSDTWERAKKKIEKFDKSIEGTSAEKMSALALAEIARQLIELNANTDILSDITEAGLNRVADSQS